MERWTIEFLPEAERDLARLERSVRRRIIGKLDWLAENFGAVFPINLRGEFKAFYKLRVGDLRVFYKANWTKEILIACYIERRDKAYKKR